MQTTKSLPIEEIRLMSLEEIADKLKILDDLPPDVCRKIRNLSYEILNTREYCQLLGIDYVELTNGRRADYAAMLIVRDGYYF